MDMAIHLLGFWPLSKKTLFLQLACSVISILYCSLEQCASINGQTDCLFALIAACE